MNLADRCLRGTRQPSSSKPFAGRMPHVLMIDDDVVALDVFGRFLTADGFNVSVAATGRAGLSLAAERGVDVVVLDLYLPDMSGLDVLAELRASALELPVVMVSGFGTLEEAAAAMRLGAVDVLSKPLDADRLVTVARSLSGGTTAPDCATAVASVLPDETDDNAHEEVSTDASPGRRDQRLVAAAQLVIDTHLADAELSLARVSGALGVSRWRLSRAFSRCGLDFRSRVRDTRMQHAARRFRTEHASSVKEVAIDLGYRHASDFSRHFRAYSGMTPTEFRRTWRRATTP